MNTRPFTSLSEPFCAPVKDLYYLPLKRDHSVIISPALFFP